MIPKEILKKVRYIELQTRHLVDTVFSGEYHSVFKGRGMEFAEVREYLPGDDVRRIDWNVTARMGHPYVKVFDEERELSVLLMVDASASGDFGTADRMKGEVGVEMCALLAFSAINNNDRVGLIVFTDEVEKFLPPKKGRKHVLRVIRELYYFKPKGRATNIAAALDYLNRVTIRRSVVFLFSDFLDAGYEAALKVANRRHDLVAVTIADPRELALPDIGIVELDDAETGLEMLVDTSDASVRQSFARSTQDLMTARQRLFRSVGVDWVDVRTDRPYIEPLMRFFQARALRFR